MNCFFVVINLSIYYIVEYEFINQISLSDNFSTIIYKFDLIKIRL